MHVTWHYSMRAMSDRITAKSQWCKLCSGLEVGSPEFWWARIDFVRRVPRLLSGFIEYGSHLVDHGSCWFTLNIMTISFWTFQCFSGNALNSVPPGEMFTVASYFSTQFILQINFNLLLLSSITENTLLKIPVDCFSLHFQTSSRSQKK
jgi:hypothetical protein